MTGIPPSVDPAVFLEAETEELLTSALRASVYERLGLAQSQRDELEAMIEESPARKVAQAALKNIRAAVWSKKNGAVRIVESHTCELAFLYKLELDPDVIGYYTQVCCSGIVRERNGKPHVGAATLDFLVFRTNSIELVECKYQDWLNEECENTKSDYKRSDLGWTHAPYSERAEALGVRLNIWAQRTPMGMYLQNLEACYALLGETITREELALSKRVSRLLKHYPYSIETLNAVYPNFNERTVLWMLANRHAFGLMRSSTPIERDRFFLFKNESHALAADAACYSTLRDEFDQPQITDPVLTASATDLAHAERRLNRLEEIAKRPELATVRMAQLAKAVAEKVAGGMSPLAACLTQYHNCGSSTPSPLTSKQRQGIRYVISDIWNKGKRNSITELRRDLKDWCDAEGERTPCATTLANYVAREDPRVRALSRGGFRSYHAVRPRAGSDKRSLPPLGYGYLLIIDSSGFDARCAPNILTQFPAEKPRFYLGIDGATGDGMAHSFIFGAARTDGMAILLREYVQRHGFLPRAIQVDRGPENTSDWLKRFCRVKGITLRHTPTGGSQFNGAAENAIKQVNTQIAHRIAGSSEPDMAGRKVDGRFKSRKTARHTFEWIHTEFLAYVYGDIPKTPDAEGVTPEEKREEVLATVGCFGTTCEFDDAFLVHTSITFDKKANASERSGVRTGSGYFTSDAMQRALRDDPVEEVRSDCVNPSVLWVKVGQRWWKAFHRTSQALAVRSPVSRLFELLFKPYARKKWREEREDVAYARHTRQKNALEAAAATSHLGPDSTSSPESQPEPVRTGRRKAVDFSSAPKY
ncbi:hypothetical protein GCM10007164_20330 [Luteimonas padinae]|uniref:Integrase catalytic domain-containing protein n=1 Tax=Luteimonas padinae TaxID=1714359 RepID=A0ABV6SVM5_9GAMM|nr:hypothetical protein [Luteimonas padinae]GHD72574.1 hypothetical protein GCM10007164_20330 [Luteimonas padinae]